MRDIGFSCQMTRFLITVGAFPGDDSLYFDLDSLETKCSINDSDCTVT